MNPVSIEIIQLGGKHANLGFSCVWTLFRNSGQLDHVSRLSIIIYLLEVFQISGTKPKKKEIASAAVNFVKTHSIVWQMLVNLNL